MHVRTFTIALAAAVFALTAPSAGAKPATAAAPAKSQVVKKRVAGVGKAPRNAATGAGTRNADLRYVSIPPAAFQPMLWSGDAGNLHATGLTASFNRGVAPVMLPDGARIREFSCFGRWKPQKNLNKAIRLRRLENAGGGGGEILAAVKVRPGDGFRRLDATLDHVVDNFKNSYQLGVVFNANPELRACRIGYEPTS